MSVTYLKNPGRAASAVMIPALTAYIKLRLCIASMTLPILDNMLSHGLLNGVYSGFLSLAALNSSSSKSPNASRLQSKHSGSSIRHTVIIVTFAAFVLVLALV